MSDLLSYILPDFRCASTGSMDDPRVVLRKPCSVFVITARLHTLPPITASAAMLLRTWALRGASLLNS